MQKIWILSLFAIASPSFAWQGFAYDTKNIDGFVGDDPETQIVITPDRMDSCHVSFREPEISGHPTGFIGGRVLVKYSTTYRDNPAQQSFDRNFYWDASRYASPLTEGFSEEYPYFHPWYDPPVDVFGTFSRVKQSLFLRDYHILFSNYYIEAEIKPTSDLTQIERVTIREYEGERLLYEINCRPNEPVIIEG